MAIEVGDITLFASGLQAPEGPAFGPDGDLYVANFGSRQGAVSRISADGRVRLFAETGGSPNGLAFNKHGDLFVADARLKRITRITPAGQISTFAREYRGASFAGPNDLIFDAQGNMFFSDPVRREIPDPCISPVYRVSPRGDVSVFAGDIAFPNGLALSPDGSELYVAEMRSNRLLAFPIGRSGSAGPPRLLYRFHEPAWPDGMAVDANGLILQTLRGSGAIAYVSPSRRRLIDIWSKPDWAPSNLAFGGPDHQTVFVTDQERGNVFTFRHDVPGSRLMDSRD